MRVIITMTVVVVCVSIAAARSAAQPPPDPGTAGTIRGVIRDRASSAPIAGISVYLVETGQVAITDEGGRFALPDVAPGAWQVIAVDPSYRKASTRVVVSADGPASDVELALVSLNLRGDEILVEVDRQRQAAGQTTMQRDEITRVPGARGDPLQAVQSLPGIGRVDTLGQQTGLVIRGSSPAESRIFVDGFEIPILYHFGGVQSVLPAEVIDGLTYSPGGFGVDYGKASAGIIEVTTRSGSDSLSGFGEVSFINTAGLARGPIGDRGNFTLGVRRSYIDAVIPLVVPEDDLQFTTLPVYYDYQARAEWKPGDGWVLSAFLFGTDDRFEAATAEADPEDPEGEASGRYFNHARFTHLIAAAAYDGGPISNRVSVLAGTQQETLEVGSDRYTRVGQQKIGARDQARIQLTSTLSLIAGGESKYTWFDVDVKIPRPEREGDPNDQSLTDDPIITADDRDTALDTAGWAALELAPAAWLKLTGGVRADWFGRNDALEIQPRAQVRTLVAADTALLGAVGLYTRPPDSNDENLQTDLLPERSWQYSIGLEQKLGHGLELTATGFYSDRRRLVVYDEGDRTAQMAGDGSDTYANDGVGRTFGGEALLRLRTDQFFGWIAYTLARSERRDHSMDEMRLFDHDQTHNVVVLGSYKLGAWQFGGRFQYVTGSPYTPVVGSSFVSDSNGYRPEFGDINSRRNPASHQLDLRVDRAFQFEHWKLSAYVDVANVYLNAPILDTEYSYDYSEREEITGLPIVPSIGVRGEF